MPDQRLVENIGVCGSESASGVGASVSGFSASDGAVAAVSAEVDHVASCGWPYASTCPRCFPPILLGDSR